MLYYMYNVHNKNIRRFSDGNENKKVQFIVWNKIPHPVDVDY